MMFGTSFSQPPAMLIGRDVDTLGALPSGAAESPQVMCGLRGIALGVVSGGELAARGAKSLPLLGEVRHVTMLGPGLAGSDLPATPLGGFPSCEDSLWMVRLDGRGGDCKQGIVFGPMVPSCSGITWETESFIGPSFVTECSLDKGRCLSAGTCSVGWS